MTPYMQVDGLTKSFGDLVLFRKISFGVAEGQRIGLIACLLYTSPSPRD